MIIIAVSYFVVTTFLTLWFLCNIGNKHNANTFVTMWKVMTNTMYGSADERVFLVCLSVFLGWVLVPYMIIFCSISHIVANVHKRRSQAIVEAARSAAINDIISNAKENAEKRND